MLEIITALFFAGPIGDGTAVTTPEDTPVTIAVMDNDSDPEGDAFTIADLNLAGVMLLLQMVKHDYSAHANVQRWADACYARPSLAAAQARD